MPPSTAREAKAPRAASQLFENVPCPFCGMICDDLTIERKDGVLKVRKNGCGRAVAGFERKLPAAGPQVKGKDVAPAEAVKAAAALIAKAKLPLFGGLATDADGMRAVLALAERAGGVVDHALSDAISANIKTLQSTGWITSTLTETRNRADLIIVAGTDLAKLHPRFFERIVAPASMFKGEPKKRDVVVIGKGLDMAAAHGGRVGEVVTLPCALDQVGEVLGAVGARLRGFRLPELSIKGVTPTDIDALAERCRTAKYGVIAWAPQPGPESEMLVARIADLVKLLNQTTRFAGLPLGGAEGAVTAGSVTTWQSGFPPRVNYASGAPDYDPYRYSIRRMLEDGEGDLLLWLASYSPDLGPPETKVPSVVLGTPGLKLKTPPAVFIPVGTPGVDHAGRLVRCDSVVSLPLHDLHRADLPRAADVLAAIEAAL